MCDVAYEHLLAIVCHCMSPLQFCHTNLDSLHTSRMSSWVVGLLLFLKSCKRALSVTSENLKSPWKYTTATSNILNEFASLCHIDLPSIFVFFKFPTDRMGLLLLCFSCQLGVVLEHCCFPLVKNKNAFGLYKWKWCGVYLHVELGREIWSQEVFGDAC